MILAQAYRHKLAACHTPEIGDATVGSLASGTSKDSSLGAPGYFAALLASVTFVDEHGEVRRTAFEVAGAGAPVRCEHLHDPGGPRIPHPPPRLGRAMARAGPQARAALHPGS